MILSNGNERNTVDININIKKSIKKILLAYFKLVNKHGEQVARTYYNR
jgi:hypothetical protein